MNIVRTLIAKSKLVSYGVRLAGEFLNLHLEKSISRKGVDIFDYKRLSSACTNDRESEIRDNNLYGIEEVFSKYINGKIGDVFFEHGVVFGSLITNNTKMTFASKIVTYGKYRHEILQSLNKKIFCVGPFIHYAQGLLDDNSILLVKRNLGKVLTVFPTHSISAVQVEYDISLFCEEIMRRSVGFDSVLVCLYWKDIHLGRAKIYESYNFKVITAGYYKDSFFLSRLKSIIQLSDMIIANDIGTFLGYCIFLNKPVFLYDQDKKYEKGSSSFQAEISQRGDEANRTLKQIEKNIYSKFNSFTSEITKDQIDLCNYIWGFDEIKSKDELKRIFYDNYK